jgi:hypothetical protein
MHDRRDPVQPDGIYPCIFEGAEAFSIWWEGEEGCLRWATAVDANKAIALLRGTAAMAA